MNTEPAIRQRDALLRLLDDEDVATVSLVKAQLAAGGPKMVGILRKLESEAPPLASFHLRDVIAEIEEQTAETQFVQLCRTFGEHGDLEKAAWYLAAALLPGEDFEDSRQLLDHWGHEVRYRLRKADTAIDRVETLAEFLNLEQRLRGNDDDYYNLRNSVLPAVIDSRLGIPISLSLVYMLVGRRAGITVDGIGLPGHFIVRHQDVFFDPFHGGRRVGLDECKALLEQQNLTLLPQHLAPTSSRQMIVRTLTNIYYIAEQSDPSLAAKVSEWITLLRQGQ
jgi:regulator of sirC expression with transglutaminase-like and TPR domain